MPCFLRIFVFKILLYGGISTEKGLPSSSKVAVVKKKSLAGLLWSACRALEKLPADYQYPLFHQIEPRLIVKICARLISSFR